MNHSKPELFTVKKGLTTLDQQLTYAQAVRWGNRTMAQDLKRAGFACVVVKTDAALHGGVWLRINYVMHY